MGRRPRSDPGGLRREEERRLGFGLDDHAPGAKVFADSGCGNCHTLKAAKTTGTVGPNLDDIQPDAKVVRQVTNGGVGMPSFGTS